jgi:hypothetical protein
MAEDNPDSETRDENKRESLYSPSVIQKGDFDDEDRDD